MKNNFDLDKIIDFLQSHPLLLAAAVIGEIYILMKIFCLIKPLKKDLGKRLILSMVLSWMIPAAIGRMMGYSAPMYPFRSGDIIAAEAMRQYVMRGHRSFWTELTSDYMLMGGYCLVTIALIVSLVTFFINKRNET